MSTPQDCQSYEDRQLVTLSLSDGQYFYCLMTRYEAKLTRYLHHLTYLPDEDIADIIEESFISAYLHLNDCDCRLRFSSWLYRIVHNQAVNFLKKHHQAVKIDIEDGADEFFDWLVSDTDIEKETITLHVNQHLQHLLTQLKPDYQEVLVLKFFEDKNYQEISDILQKPLGTVATLLSRAKIQFKKLYEKEN